MDIYIDFESRSQIDIWKSGAYRYAEDKTTEILCLAWAKNMNKVKGALRGKTLKLAVEELNDYVNEGALFHAHNAYFERCVWKFCLTPVYGALPVPIKQWRCTMAKASAHALPRGLDKCAQALKCKHQKDQSGKRLMIALSKTTGAIEKEKLDALLAYCVDDVETERDIDKKIPDLTPFEQRVWSMDQYLNDNGVRIDVDAIKKAADLIELDTKELNEELFNLTGGLINKGTQTKVIKSYLESKGLVLPNLQKATVQNALAESDGSNLRILQLRQQLSLTSNAKYNALSKAVSHDERVRDLLVYHGASTGRWTGKLFQIHNLVKASISPQAVDNAIHMLKESESAFYLLHDVLPTLSSCIRGMFIPSEGCEMLITDFASIEARVIMWLAGEESGLKLFTESDNKPELPDIYVHMARTIYNDLTIVKKDKTKRNLGKQTILGSGFGMGPKRFQETCEKYRVECDSRLAERAIQTYRKVFSKVPRLWYAMEDAAKKTVLSGKPHKCGYVMWYIDGEFLKVRLPSGRSLAYHHPKVTADGRLTFLAVNSTTKQYVTEDTWGGTLAENVTQAVARDIMVVSMFNFIKKGFKILFTVHDELVLEVPTGTKTEQDVLDIVRQVPEWAKGCPINAECEKTERYKK